MILNKTSYTNAVISNDHQDLQSIHNKTKNIAIYQRDISAIKEELDQLQDQKMEYQASGTAEELRSALSTYFTPYPALLADISSIVQLFESLTESSSLRLLLATVQTNMCRKFHTDINNLRLLCTYIGPGTLWLPDEGVDQRALLSRNSERSIAKEDHYIQQVRTGDVVILKGALYPDSNPIIHRSPAIETTNAKRLLLRIDTNEFLSFQ